MVESLRIIVLCFLFVFFNVHLGHADEVSDDYSARIFNYKTEIISKATDAKLAAIGGTKRAKEAAEKDFEALGKEIDAFKSEATKYYRGKMPKKLKTKLQELVIYYQEKRGEVYRSIIESYQR